MSDPEALKKRYLAILESPPPEGPDGRPRPVTQPWQTTAPARADEWRKLMAQAKPDPTKAPATRKASASRPWNPEANIIVFFDGVACEPAEDGIGNVIPALLDVDPKVSYQIRDRLGEFQRLFLHVYEVVGGVPAINTGFTLDAPSAPTGKGLMAPGTEFHLAHPPKGVRMRSHATGKILESCTLKPDAPYVAEFVVTAKLGGTSLVVSFQTRPAGEK